VSAMAMTYILAFNIASLLVLAALVAAASSQL
jgi:NADH:ubiquinone oxidoreductase subunit 6 (subunit J)